ncbi:MAG TPA: C40 family peptidase [Streptosporangiaceae bacterium]
MRDKARPLAALAVGIGLVGVGAGFGGAGGSSSATPLTGSAQLTSYTRAFPGSADSTSGAGTQSAAGAQSSATAQATAATESSTAAEPVVAPLHGLRQADLIVVASASLPSGTLARIRKLAGVTAAESLEAARIQLNGKFTAVLGVNPSTFRSYAAKQTAASDKLWQNVASGAVSVSYTMGQDDKLKAGGTVHANGAKQENLRVGGLGTVGIKGVDAVVSDQVARSLGVPAGNAIVISAPKADLAKLVAAVKKVIPHGAAAEPLMSQVTAGVTKNQASAAGVAAGTVDHSSTTLSAAEDLTFLKAGLSRQGLPYVWGASGPNSFDCSGLVQWAMARAGIQMPRVAADQARTGPAVPVSQLQPGDLLFYHTDPTDPGYISHVAIYLGHDEMLQAPQTGENVEVVPADVTSSEYAGAVRVDPALAAQVAGNI